MKYAVDDGCVMQSQMLLFTNCEAFGKCQDVPIFNRAADEPLVRRFSQTTPLEGRLL